jgi:hypothetical protein
MWKGQHPRVASFRMDRVYFIHDLKSVRNSVESKVILITYRTYRGMSEFEVKHSESGIEI